MTHPATRVRSLRRHLAVSLVTLGLAATVAQAQPATRAEIEAFMKNAKVVRTRELSTGITRPLRMTLQQDAVTHDAVFQAIDERKTVFMPSKGPSEINFVDSWRYNVAAYRVAAMVGLDWMMPVTIEYRYRGRHGALSWWMDSIMDEKTRLKQKVPPPDALAWNRDMYRMRIFSSLVYDTDRNLGNILVSPSWRVIMVDFTRAFRLHPEIKAKDIHQCDRQLLARLESLTPESVRTAVADYLTGSEANALIQRRDLLVTHIRSLIAQHGEEKVLY